MYLPAESIYDGTWSGQAAAPEEVAHYELMREMGWSFAELQETPHYVRRYCTDLMTIRRAAQARHANRRG